MKKIYFSIAFLFLLIAGCGDDASEVITPPVAVCGNINSFTVTQENDKINFTLSTNSEALYYDISVINAQDDNPESGNKVILSELSGSFKSEELYLPPGTYKVFVRSVCTDGSKSEWSAPKIFEFADYCSSPENLGISLFTQGIGFVWESSDSATSFYEVSYGPQGFTLGNGTTTTVNQNYFIPSANANTTYDFYVRSYCTSATGWSSWSGPYTYFSEANQNLCSQPTNLSYVTVGSSSANFQWSFNGESQFEYALVAPGQTIATTNIHTIGNTSTPTFTGLSSWATYTFYVRAVCANGNKTAWTTIVVDL